MPELVINVSNIISPLCYSIIRVEPYTSCPHRCIYCYARWYRGSLNTIVLRRKALSMFESIARKIYRRGLRAIPARVSTLIDPLPPHEELYNATLRILRICLEYEYPVIVNTKSVMAIRNPWRKILSKLAERNLIVYQVSISTMDEHISRVLEPFAPSPSKRLLVAKHLAEDGIPIIIRISPFIPEISLYPNIDEVVQRFADIGVRHVIVEILRIEKELCSFIESIISKKGLKGIEYESYSLREVNGFKPVVRISLRSRLRYYALLSRTLKQFGITFSTCKEGLFDIHTAPNCCGMHLLDRDRIALRITLFEIYRYILERGPIDVDDIHGVVKNLSLDKVYITSQNIDLYPSAIKKPIKYHERKLLKVLRSKQLLEHVAPTLVINDNVLLCRSSFEALLHSRSSRTYHSS